MSQMIFNHVNHTYGFEDDTRKWTSATAFVSLFHEEFNALFASISCSNNPRTKWYGMDPKVIRDHWQAKAKFSAALGHWYHSKKESEIIQKGSIEIRKQWLPVIDSPTIDGIKLSRNQSLKPGFYVEHLLYDEPNLLCGIADIVAVSRDYIDIFDHKTSFEITKSPFKDKRMYAPIQHVKDANFWHYAIQMNLYMYMALKANPTKKMGEMKLMHVKFNETAGPLGERLIEGDFDNGFEIKEVSMIKVPDMQADIKKMIRAGRHLRP